MSPAGFSPAGLAGLSPAGLAGLSPAGFSPAGLAGFSPTGFAGGGVSSAKVCGAKLNVKNIAVDAINKFFFMFCPLSLAL